MSCRVKTSRVSTLYSMQKLQNFYNGMCKSREAILLRVREFAEMYCLRNGKWDTLRDDGGDNRLTQKIIAEGAFEKAEWR